VNLNGRKVLHTCENVDCPTRERPPRGAPEPQENISDAAPDVHNQHKTRSTTPDEMVAIDAFSDPLAALDRPDPVLDRLLDPV
jgi:hypothetical protein